MAAKSHEEPDEKQIANVGESTNGNVLRLDESKRYTYADYLTWNDDKRRELINGVVRLMPLPPPAHADISKKISDIIRKGQGACKVFHAPFDLRLPVDGETDNAKICNVVQPDVCVVCDSSKLDEGGCIGAPDLVVEVQSPSSIRYNLSEKYDLYEAAGVKEYWVVSPKMNVITVFVLQDKGKFDRGTVYESGSKIQTKTLEGLEVSLDEIFH